MSVEQRKQGKNRNSRRRNKIAIREATGQTAGESHILEIQLLQKKLGQILVKTQSNTTTQ